MSVPNIDYTFEMAEFERVIEEMVIDRQEPTFNFEKSKPAPEPFLLDDFDYDEQEIDEFQKLEKAIKYLSLKHKSVQTDDVQVVVPSSNVIQCCDCNCSKKEEAVKEAGAQELTHHFQPALETTETKSTSISPSSMCDLTSDGDTDCDPGELDSDEMEELEGFLENDDFSETDWEDNTF